MSNLVESILPFESSSLFKQDSSDQSMDQKLLRKLYETVERNMRNEQFSVEDLASEVAYSRSHLHRKLHDLTGRSISQFIRKIRLDHSTEYLKMEAGTVSEIAFKVGFGSSTYFIKCFHEEFGFSPGEVKRRLWEGGTENKGLRDFIPSVKPTTEVTPLEALHPAASQQLILEIFEMLAKHKPVLDKFLILDDEEDTPDVRLLAYQIIKNYPWPIGVEVRRLFSASLGATSQSRLAQLIKTIDRSLKVLMFISLAELTRQLVTERVTLGDFPRAAELSLSNLDITTIINNLKIISSALKGAKGVFVLELSDVLDQQLFRELDDLLMELNDDGAANGQNIETQCQNMEQALMFVLKKLAFLSAYKMVNVGSISVQKRQFDSPQFAHHFHLLNSTDSDFKIHEQVMQEFSDSQAVLLMKSVKDAQHFLNLSPWIVDTHREPIEGKKVSSLKRDVFLYNRYQNGQFEYTGAGSTVTDDLSMLDGHTDLDKEYLMILKLLKQ